jgi:hypothetical protein
MASERQIAANPRDAKKSTGPRTEGGKKRARRNGELRPVPVRHDYATIACQTGRVDTGKQPPCAYSALLFRC